ncbi:cytochrome P450 4c3-like [Frankliniella occidentalis]|uniref:Cytochrome P450 4c3-like n=1 Tax=Frankliniella occidentalis TaxID=133901 RepID=A0A9C6XQ65_FRAOC|nr:cytochrome P450 4c3-like [Frankliniella occidentalis]
MDVLIVLLGGFLLLILTTLALKRKAFVDKINALPGPPSVPILGHLLYITKHNFEALAAAIEQQTKYPNGFKFWMFCFPYVFLNTVESVEAVLSSVHHIDKSPDYSTLHPWLRFGLLTSTGAKWHARRRLLTPTFHFRILDQFLPAVNEYDLKLFYHPSGQKFAMMEMKCIIAHMLIKLRFLEAYPGYKPELTGELILKSKNEQVLLRVEQRH